MRLTALKPGQPDRCNRFIAPGRSNSSRGTPRFSGPKATSSSTTVPTIWLSGFWSTRPTRDRTSQCAISSAVSSRRPEPDPLGEEQPVGKSGQRRLARAVSSDNGQSQSRGRRVSVRSLIAGRLGAGICVRHPLEHDHVPVVPPRMRDEGPPCGEALVSKLLPARPG